MKKQLLNICKEKNPKNLLEKIKSSIKKGTDINAKTKLNQTPLHLICQWQKKNSVEIIKYLVEKGTDINAKTKLNQTPLHLVCKFQKKNSVEIIKYFVEKGTDINAKTKLNQTPLHLVCQFQKINSVEIIKYFVEKGTDINAKTKLDQTPLHLVCQWQSRKGFEIIKYLVEKGADINVKTTENQTPLHLVYQFQKVNSFEIIKYLVEKGADVNIQNVLDETILHLVCKDHSQKGNTCEMMRFLVEKGANVNSLQYTKETPLHYIFHYQEKNVFEMVKILVEKGANINAQSENSKSTPFHFAFSLPRKNVFKIIQYLIQNGADVNIKTAQNRTPLYFAAQNNREYLIEILLLNNANIYDLLDTQIKQEYIDLFTQIYSFNQDSQNFLKSNDNFSDLGIKSNDSFTFQAHQQILLMRLDQNETILQQFIKNCSQKSKETVEIVLNFIYSGIYDFENFSKILTDFLHLQNRYNKALKNHLKLILPFEQFHEENKEISKIKENHLNKIEKQKEIIESFFKEIGIDSDWIEKKSRRKGILKDFTKFYHQNETKDFTIIVDEKEIKVHKLILMIRSELFKGMFQLNISDKSNKVHDYSKKSFETINQLIYFLYHDEFEETKLNNQIIEELYDVKDYYQLNPNSIIDLILFDGLK
ncbi:phytochrome-interacting ankyrin-repeat protein [Anaeramoeba ignava]|uniref:Phytochrome-interacting ankyrin-repeat protein n=1 Tax=Anaeramoeba ignava TaxID=1746090 RepID=A0A9Q0RBU7_ANAIG|nr:phytochrome-interacting ankyrin-repeat protein [Anaeramoeba ignava]